MREGRGHRARGAREVRPRDLHRAHRRRRHGPRACARATTSKAPQLARARRALARAHRRRGQRDRRGWAWATPSERRHRPRCASAKGPVWSQARGSRRTAKRCSGTWTMKIAHDCVRRFRTSASCSPSPDSWRGPGPSGGPYRPVPGDPWARARDCNGCSLFYVSVLVDLCTGSAATGEPRAVRKCGLIEIVRKSVPTDRIREVEQRW